MTTQHTTGDAIQALKDGMRVRRAGWNAKGMWLKLKAEAGNMQAFVYMKTFADTLVPWVCSQTDLLADDWEILESDDVDVDDVYSDL